MLLFAAIMQARDGQAMTTDELERVFSTRGRPSRQPQPFRRLFVSLGRLVSLEPAAPVFHAGDGSGGVFGIVSGGVAVMDGSPWQRPALAHIERAGGWFSDMDRSCGEGPGL
jgi:hypothetical protein